MAEELAIKAQREAERVCLFALALLPAQREAERVCLVCVAISPCPALCTALLGGNCLALIAFRTACKRTAAVLAFLTGSTRLRERRMERRKSNAE